MRKMPVFALFLFSAWTALPASVHADDIPATSKVFAVTAYANLATVTRTGSVHLPQGPQTVVIADMPSGFNEDSLRVEGETKGDVKIGSVEVKRVILTELASATEQEKAKALQAKRDERAMVEAELNALRVKANFIEHLAHSDDPSAMPGATQRTAAPMGFPQQSPSVDLPPEKWNQAWTMLQTGMTETQKAIVSKEIAKRSLDEEIARLEKEYDTVRTAKRERRDVVLHVQADSATDFSFSITYQTHGVSWMPLYDARLNTEKAELHMEQYGQIAQSTGEDWSDIRLTFSTAQPQLGSEMPQPTPWYVGNERRDMLRMNGISFKMMQQDAQSLSTGGAPPGSMQEEDETQVHSAAPIKAVVAQTGYTVEFNVPGKINLKSVREPSKFFIAEQTMKASLSAQTFARKDPHAYLFAQVKNETSYPFVPGSVSKYRDGAFIGQANLPLLRPDETADFAFGVDEHIKVSFQKVAQAQANPLLRIIGDSTLERLYRTKAQNLHKTPLSIVVIDQYPVSTDPNMKVSLMEDLTTKGYEKDPQDRQGVIRWTATYQPQEEKAFDTAFSVKYPKGSTVPDDL